VDHREAALAEVGARYHAVLWFRREITAAAVDARVSLSKRRKTGSQEPDASKCG
jgi:hypothetical protein